MPVAFQSAHAQFRPDDPDPLGRYVRTADPEAFADVVRRYGPMVYAVCRRLLGTFPVVDDAFQATFMVLLWKAASVKAGAAGGWLFAVARRTCLYARSRRAARRRGEHEAGRPRRPAGGDQAAFRRLTGVRSAGRGACAAGWWPTTRRLPPLGRSRYSCPTASASGSIRQGHGRDVAYSSMSRTTTATVGECRYGTPTVADFVVLN
ncbi:MAG: RNA polymerase sigma factor [Armatimonadaceae bacterium]